MLIIFFGNIGTGKTTLAREVARKINAEFICFDEAMWEVVDKKQMYDGDKFLLTLDEIISVYDFMHKKAEPLIKQGKDVVLESMYFKTQRQKAIEIAKKFNIAYLVVEVTCNEEEIKKRLEKRKKQNSQTGSFQLYLKYRDLMGPEESEHIVINTTDLTIEESSKKVIEELSSIS